MAKWLNGKKIGPLAARTQTRLNARVGQQKRIAKLQAAKVGKRKYEK